MSQRALAPQPSLAESTSPGSLAKWALCGLLLLATMLNYMDRMTLSLTITDISRELKLTDTQYGALEAGFGFAFAAGGLVIGALVDRVSVRWIYPIVLLGWSLAGVATAYALQVGTVATRLVEALAGPYAAPLGATPTERAYLGMMICRVTLGFFEAGHWPCALVTTQRLLSRKERPLGNSLLQSGAAFGAILTPIVVQMLVSDVPGSWRGPFVVIGLGGLSWILPWWYLARPSYLQRPESFNVESLNVGSQNAGSSQAEPVTDVQPPAGSLLTILKQLAALVIVVIMINLTWQFFRAWLPKFLREYHDYDRTVVNYFTSAYYISADIGCLSIGFLTRWLAARGWGIHTARMTTFAACAALTSLSLLTATLPRGPLLLGLFLLIAFGSLGLFPNYYSFTQEISLKHQGKITGVLGATTWIVTSLFQVYVGQRIDETKSYATGISLAGWAPLVALAALLLLWPTTRAALSENDLGKKDLSHPSEPSHKIKL